MTRRSTVSAGMANVNGTEWITNVYTPMFSTPSRPPESHSIPIEHPVGRAASGGGPRTDDDAAGWIRRRRLRSVPQAEVRITRRLRLVVRESGHPSTAAARTRPSCPKISRLRETLHGATNVHSYG